MQYHNIIWDLWISRIFHKHRLMERPWETNIYIFFLQGFFVDCCNTRKFASGELRSYFVDGWIASEISLFMESTTIIIRYTCHYFLFNPKHRSGSVWTRDSARLFSALHARRTSWCPVGIKTRFAGLWLQYGKSRVRARILQSPSRGSRVRLRRKRIEFRAAGY